ncbi:serine/threonine-protein kinase/endoribonuclease ire-1-like [Xyrauchen texanus]|uniref:serine/threonine-protein kinase/endoribonuclease ire-1-like n=1 Tax=Xyrauchen texanus TaxID=154827 RepID=UPI002241E490|nr:serine/threonine-protein kinase/endoribonuclease ire-1-like [Xyrauchen texanus]XP_051988297.1 serine/threonine-protein kinase/endoribonuclease ire-1-like [Xyrauchen texanus]
MAQQQVQFVNTHYDVLIKRVNGVLPIADKLKTEKIIQRETYSQICLKSTTNMAKMRVLLNALNTDKAKCAFYEVLKAVEPLLVEELEKQGSSSQTSREEQETKSYPQNTKAKESERPAMENITEKKQLCRWNKFTIKYGKKMMKLYETRESLYNVGNLFFCKEKDYIIGSGGSGTLVYLGFKRDGTEVAIKRITKNPINDKVFENELKHLQKLQSTNQSQYLVKYVDLEEDEDFYYLALQLCDYDLVDYMDDLRQQEEPDRGIALKRVVSELLHGLKTLHSADVIHRDLKPRNVLIDAEKHAKLADFGICRKLEEGRTTVYTDRAGTLGWEATEILNQAEKGVYKKSSDIQVAGMLVYYIISEGKHPFGELKDRESNVKAGIYSLNDVRDIVAKDLIEWMISKEKEERLSIGEVLIHPYFWDDERKVAVLKILGDRKEVQEFKTPAKHPELSRAVQKYTKGKSFSDWKSKPLQRWTKIDKNLPEDLLGLLRFLRNILVHEEEKFQHEEICDRFPDFFISLYKLAKDMDWKYLNTE